MAGTHGDEGESWFYSYDAWLNQQHQCEKASWSSGSGEIIESGKSLNSEQPHEPGSSYMNQSFLTGEADLLEVEQIGQHIVFKVCKGGITGQVTRVILNAKEARTLIMMLATAVEGGPLGK